MAIKICVKDNYIPISIGELEFKFLLNDESILEFRKKALNVFEEIKKTELDQNQEFDDVVSDLKEALKGGFDLVLGNDSFEMIYQQTPSCLKLAAIFTELYDGIEREFSEMSDGFKKKENQYKGKRPKNQNNVKNFPKNKKR